MKYIVQIFKDNKLVIVHKEKTLVKAKLEIAKHRTDNEGYKYQLTIRE